MIRWQVEPKYEILDDPEGAALGGGARHILLC